MEKQLNEIEIYLTSQGRAPFLDWLNSLRDAKARAKIRVRLGRITLGNFGDCKYVGDGIFELRIDFCPGYRLYYGLSGEYVVLLLCGGDKSSQQKDIKKAKNYWRDYSVHYEKKNKKFP